MGFGKGDTLERRELMESTAVKILEGWLLAGQTPLHPSGARVQASVGGRIEECHLAATPVPLHPSGKGTPMGARVQVGMKVRAWEFKILEQ